MHARKWANLDSLIATMVVAIGIGLAVSVNLPAVTATNQAETPVVAQVKINGVVIQVFDPGCAFDIQNNQVTVDSPSLSGAVVTAGPNNTVSLTLNDITIDAQNTLRLRQGSKPLITIAAGGNAGPAAKSQPGGPIKIIDGPAAAPTIPVPANTPAKPKTDNKKVKSSKPENKPMVK